MKCPICYEIVQICHCMKIAYWGEIARLKQTIGANQLGCEKEIARLKKELKKYAHADHRRELLE